MERSIRISTTSLSDDDGMTLALFNGSDGGEIISDTDGATGMDMSALPTGTYVLRVKSNLIPTIYNVLFDFGPGDAPARSTWRRRPTSFAAMCS